MSKKMLIILMTLLTTSILGGVYFTYAQEVDENQVASENLLSMLTESEVEVTFLFETIVGDGGEVPEDAEKALMEAQELHVEAQSLYNEGSHEECVEKATEALNKYGEALIELIPEEPETMTTQEKEESEETEKLKGLTTAIEKAWSRITKLGEIADELENQGIDVTQARTCLADAGDILGAIPAILQEDPEEAENMLAMVKSIIGEATGLLKSDGEPIKQEKIAHFTQQAQHHADQLGKKMMRIMEKHGLSTEVLQSEYSALMEGFEGVVTDVTKDKLKNSVTELKALVKQMNKFGNGHVDDEVGFSVEVVESINKQMKIESSFERYRNRILKLYGNGAPDEIQDLLNQAEGLLVEAEEALATGEKNTADELVEEAEEILEMIDEVMDGVKEGLGKGVKSSKGFDDELGIDERIDRISIIIQKLFEDGEDVSEYKEILDDIFVRLNDDTTDEEMDKIEEEIEQLEEQLFDHGKPSKDKTHKKDIEQIEDPEDPETNTT